MQLFNESRLLKCFHFENVRLSREFLNIFFLKENKTMGTFEPFTFKYSNETNKQTVTTPQANYGSGHQVSSPSIPAVTSPSCGPSRKWQFLSERKRAVSPGPGAEGALR